MIARSLEERADLLGLTCREVVALAQTDSRVLAPPAIATDGAVARLRRWLDAGRPDADLTALVFLGDGAVREIVRETLRTLPAPVQWHAVHGVVWFEVGRRNSGCQSVMPTLPAPPQGDQPHVILMCGTVPDERLPHLAAHELAHSWQRHVYREPCTAPPITHQEFAAPLRAAEFTTEEIARYFHRREVVADMLAEIWGFRAPPGSSDHARLQHFESSLAAHNGGEIQ